MIEQILKLDGSKMVRISADRVVQLIEDKVKGTPFEIIHRVIDKNSLHVLQSSMMVASVDKGGIVKVSFHVAVRSDVVYQLVTRLKEIEEIKSLDISVFYYDPRELKMYYGSDAEQKMLTDLKSAIIGQFMFDQTELMMLKNMKVPYVC